MLDIFNLKGKLALFTGASRGLGKAMAVGLASNAPDYVNGTIITVDGGWMGR